MFTKNQIQEIGRKLGLLGKKDTDFEDAKLPLSGEEYIVLVQNGKNVKTKIKNLGGNFQPDNPDNPEVPDTPSDPEEPEDPSISDVTINITPTSLSDVSDDGETRTLTVEYKYAKVIDDYVLNPISTNWISLELTNVEDKPSEYTIKYTYNVTVYPNENTNTRSAEIKFGAIGINDSTKLVSCKVNQLGQPDVTVSITFEPSKLTFDYNEVNVTKEFVGTFVNCVPVSGVSDNDVVIEYIETLGGGKYKFTAKALKANNSSKNITYTGRVQYKDTLGYTAYKTIPIVVNKAPSASLVISPSPVNVPYTGASNTIVAKITNAVEDSLRVGTILYDWLTVEKTSSTSLKLSVIENPYNKQRSANVGVYVTGLDGVEKSETLQVIQAPNTEIEDGGEVDNSTMYIGYINDELANKYDLLKDGLSEIYSNIVEEAVEEGVEMGIISKETFESKGKTLFGDTPKETALLILIPTDSNMKVYIDGGLGSLVEFNHSYAHANGEKTVSIDGVSYSIYGEFQSNEIGGDNGVLKYYYIQ